MQQRIALCIDEITGQHPETIGLDGESLASLNWIALFSSGSEAREALSRERDITRAWVHSCDDIEPINLAATLKADRPGLYVSLIASERCGSLFSRAHTAMIDEVIDTAAFPGAYARAKSEICASSSTIPQSIPNAVAPSTHETTDPVSPLAAQGESLGEGADRSLSPTLGTQTNAYQAAAHITNSKTIAQAQTAFIMPIVSGSGGAGKSSVAVMAAFIASRMGYRTALLDYDLQFGDAAALSGTDNALAIDVAISHPDKLVHELERTDRLTVFAAPSRLEVAETIVKSMPDFIDALAQSFEVIIANTGAAWAEQHAVLLERSSAAVFLVDQRASSLRACAHALELCARCGIATGPFTFAVNRCAKNAPLTAADVSCALDGANVFELKDGGRDVEDYLGSGNAADLLASRNEFCMSLERVMTRILPGASSRVEESSFTPEERRPFLRRGRHADRKRQRNGQ